MSDYIKREDAVLAIVAFLRFTQPMARRIVDEIPSADVVDRESYESMERTVQKITDAIAKTEQKHGKWIKEDDGSLFYRCSACGKAQYGNFSEIWMGEYHFCPNCGASMESPE